MSAHPHHPQRSAHDRLNVIVVGAGIVGAACAEALALGGARVRVFDGRQPAGGATAAGMGHILVLDDSPAQFALTRRSRELWDARSADWPSGVEREACGTLWVAADEEELSLARQKAAWFAQRGVRAEELTSAELRRSEPNLRAGLAGGLLFPEDSVVYPPVAALHLLETARRSGAEFHFGEAVARIGDGCFWTRSGAFHQADVLVLAAGLDSADLLDPELGWPELELIPKKGHLAITDRAPGFLRHQIVELGYLKSAHGGDQDSVAFNAQPRLTGQVLLGSSRQVGVRDSGVEPAMLARMLCRALEYMPALAALSVLRTWVGVRPSTRDNLPLIGPLPAAPRTWFAAGHEGLGITTSLGTAELIAAGLLGAPSDLDPRPYLPERLARAGALHG